MRKFYLSALASLLGCICALSAQTRIERLLEKNWKFTREDDPVFIRTDYNDSQWQTVTVPHDWAIYGPFNPQNDKQEVAIAQDGQVKASEHAGRTGGLPFVGVGWYRLNLEVPQLAKGQRATLLFDGAMSHAKVYLNGEQVGYWAYGYNSFYLDVTPYLKEGNNTLAVRLENLAESSRWYPGAGLYRNVHLILTNEAHIPLWGTYLTTPKVTDAFAKVHLCTQVELPEGADPNSYTVETQLLNPDKQPITSLRTTLAQWKYNDGMVEQDFLIQKPALWSPDSPSLYTAVTKLYEGSTLKDEYTTPFGVRSIEFVPDDGFYLNGQKTYFKGVCNHHDLGPLGAAVNDAAIRRQIRILKEMGCNAIRTSHNMPAPELVRACDEMGMMLMPESFDEWSEAKCANGYHLDFNEWVEKDIVNLVRHFRNSPSVIFWSIGNEVPDQHVQNGGKTSKWLQDICHREDPSRTVTQGMNEVEAAVSNNYASVMDIAGFNYHPYMLRGFYDKLPQRLILGTETASTVSSRGVYKFPVERKGMALYDDHQSSGYDVEHCRWSNLPEDDFLQYADLPYCMGEFVWTGFDYLGEPTPYYSNWPSHSSLFGIIDLAGIPKDRYYLYKSHWNPKEKTLHILPHWTWPGREGEVTPVFVYTNYPSAELFINGKSQGKRTKDTSITIADSETKEAKQNLVAQKRYRLMWMDTRYEPGTVKVVAYDETGKAVAEEEIHTAGTPHHIELHADRDRIQADGKDLSFINVRVVDREGNLCPEASHKISFSVKGAGTYKAAANGDAASLESFQAPQMSLFKGQLTAIVQAGESAGSIIFEASAPGVRSSKIEIQTE